MIKTAKHKITAITRADSTSSLPDGVEARRVDYNDPSTLVAALKGCRCQVLIVTMGARAPQEQQTKLIEAAAAADVPYVLPNEFGTDYDNEEYGKDIMLGPKVQMYRRQIEKAGKSSWIGLACGFWYEYSLGGSVSRYGFDIKERKVLFYDEGAARLNTSTWPKVGRAMANLLSVKLLPDDANDESGYLDKYKNRTVWIDSFLLSQQDISESILRVTGTSRSEWSISHTPVKEYYGKAMEELKAGSMEGFSKALYSRSFYPDEPANFGKKHGLDNDILGLPKEDLDAAMKAAWDLSRST